VREIKRCDFVCTNVFYEKMDSNR